MYACMHIAYTREKGSPLKFFVRLNFQKSFLNEHCTNGTFTLNLMFLGVGVRASLLVYGAESASQSVMAIILYGYTYIGIRYLYIWLYFKKTQKYKSFTAYPIKTHIEKVKNRWIPFVQRQVTCDSYPFIYTQFKYHTKLCYVYMRKMLVYPELAFDTNFDDEQHIYENRLCVKMLSMSTEICTCIFLLNSKVCMYQISNICIG